MDSLTKKERSLRMSLVKNRDTKPEMVVRKLIFSLGYRYRLHASDIPGRPDLVFRQRGKLIFVHGCFWHRHLGCSRCRMPKSRIDFWRTKLNGNRKRDQLLQIKLAKQGWEVPIIWECETENAHVLRKTIRKWRVLVYNGVL